MNGGTTTTTTKPSINNRRTVAGLSSRTVVVLGLVAAVFAQFQFVLVASPKFNIIPSSSSSSSPSSSSSVSNNSPNSLLVISPSFDDKDWPELKNNICPNRIPNPKVWKTIFHLARNELGFDNSIFEEKEEEEQQQLGVKVKEDTFDNFFKFSFGGVGYTNLSSQPSSSSSSSSSSSLIYLKVWKGGNDYIRYNLQQSVGVSLLSRETREELRRGITTTLYNGYSYSETGNEKEGQQAVLYRNMKILDDTPSSIITHNATDSTSINNNNNNTNGKKKPICIVTAVRDPVSHFLSAYNEIEYRTIERPFQKRLPSIRSKNTNPILFTRYKHGSTQRFRQFVSDFLGGPVRAGIVGYKAELQHLYSMTGILYELNRINDCFGPRSMTLLHAANNNNRTDANQLHIPWTLSQELHLTGYLPSLTNLSTTFPKLVTDSCPGLPPEVGKPFEKTILHKSQIADLGFNKAAKQIWKEGGDVARSLCALHVLDYACFDLIPIPDLCKDVYSKNEFRQQLLSASIIRNDDGSTVNNQHEDYHKCFEWSTKE